ncbi:non-specific lipid transfer protein GPI-anchored 5 isoform X2 [Beta vulgaris subsp. vulgaris]|uniref:non-specific lipid transfer protein GPI-anchored 5 isoform X2 n=1 Tax=Beta vulgaris subsp. vulgaris TaxID=3555 RepID=UPI002036738C|nr:non-specific lipid transfer protein GPI-anchored 5 isoform X2 [Beta vulgaris subsp. vulgaris]
MASLVAMVLVMSMLSGGALAQSGCTSAIVGLAPCLNYISGSSSSPSSSCCAQLSSVVQSQPQCLCQVLNGGGSSFGVTINQTQALALPSACNVQTPPVSRCNGNQPSGSSGGSPVASPSNTPADASPPEGSVTPDTPTVSSIPSAGSGSKSTTGSTSNGNMTKFSIHFTLFLLFITSSVSAIIVI